MPAIALLDNFSKEHYGFLSSSVIVSEVTLKLYGACIEKV